jgi:hypothetical protein
VALIFARKDDQSYTIDEIDALWATPRVYIATAVSAGALAAVVMAVARLGRTPPALLTRKQAATDAFGRAFIGASPA